MTLPPRIPKKAKRSSRWRDASFVCETCGSTVTREDKPGVIYGAFKKLRFCSQSCSRIGSRTNHENHFWNSIQKEPENSPEWRGCWIWTASVMDKGYGVLHVDGRKTYAHRYSYELHNGPLGGAHVLHSCDNPACVNPKHLRAGTHQENMRDAAERGRWAWRKGTAHPSAKLSAEQVAIVRSSSAKGVDLARQFNVSKSTIYAIRKNQNWRGS